MQSFVSIDTSNRLGFPDIQRPPLFLSYHVEHHDYLPFPNRADSCRFLRVFERPEPTQSPCVLRLHALRQKACSIETMAFQIASFARSSRRPE
jgi:hypothetical protein